MKKITRFIYTLSDLKRNLDEYNHDCLCKSTMEDVKKVLISVLNGSESIAKVMDIAYQTGLFIDFTETSNFLKILENSKFSEKLQTCSGVLFPEVNEATVKDNLKAEEVEVVIVTGDQNNESQYVIPGHKLDIFI